MHSIKTKKLQTFSVTFLLLGLSSGSAFYILDPLIKPAFILVIISIITLSISRDFFIDKLGILILSLILLSALFNLLYPNANNMLDIYFISLLYPIYVASRILAKKYRNNESAPVAIILLLVTVNFIIYLYENVSGSMLIAKQADETGLYSAAFNNPNDLAAFISIFAILLIFLIEKRYKSTLLVALTYTILFLFIFSLGSRSALLIMASIPILYLAFERRSFSVFLILLLFIILISILDLNRILEYLADLEIEAIARSASRVILITDNYNEDKSVNYRLDSYLYAVQHLHEAILGTGTKNYETFYGHEFLGTVVTKNPHSLFIEITIAFGWIGLAILLAVLSTIGNKYLVLRNEELFFALLSLLIFIIITFIPSTIIRLPILFFPIFFFYSISKIK